MTASELLHPTAEQVLAINQAQQGQSFKVIAYAGTGKTTTLQMISAAMPQRRGMYLAFNKAIASEAQQKFHRNVDCRTFHSLAYRSVARGITDKLRLPRLSPSFMAKAYRLEPITLRRLMGGRYEKFVLMPSRLASLVANAVSYFCSTSSQYPAPRHIQAPSWLHADDIETLQQYLYPAVERRWLESTDSQHQAGIGHDVYLKLWALSDPNIPADYVLFDEAQDADPLMLGILLRQRNTQVIYVGDAHQQIYAWRGAVNAMQQLPLPESRLTTSFRFGEDIAHVANALLGALDEKVPLLGNPELKSRVVNKPHTKMRDAILCRTNARAMELLLSGLVQGDKVSLQADHVKLNRFVDAASLLKQGKRVVDVPELAWFNSWHDVHEYCETNDGSDIKPLVKLVDEHGTDPLKKALAKITPITEADYVISTAHKAKGLEWNRVHLEDDYQFKINGLEHKISDEELRLLYVACTRAKVSLNIHHIYDLVQQLKIKTTSDRSKNKVTV
ncbi:UvrD-helicase domain-containing protein [Acinetobacter rudis]|uniref:DNA 3'-5' helicase n=1 Tax=Acinetobacter rudis TaxID=632955 RepID=A0AAW8J552_9GAMM|nr:UvrD-helicase domain-containing protein [Acinetobacter rudis]MDQ8935176.1 AAA family ATPase [Acinetobacter rudis]MDQ8953039.1 AAA family ATPase [Acinetobacter rudis]MDQ9017044.1 AAA family ATPase [Acinetobacter rudis]